MLNQVALIGRLTKDVELKYTRTEKPVVSFTLAVDRDFRGESDVDFIDCVAFGKPAEIIDRYIKKGQRMIITGRIQVNNWTDSSGEKRKSVCVIAEKAYFVERKSEDVENIKFTEVSSEDGELPF